jgi:biotin carboxyl carrier protein
MEAMKMEHHLAAAGDGVVSAVHVTVDDQVEGGAVLLVVEAAEEDGS